MNMQTRCYAGLEKEKLVTHVHSSERFLSECYYVKSPKACEASALTSGQRTTHTFLPVSYLCLLSCPFFSTLRWHFDRVSCKFIVLRDHCVTSNSLCWFLLSIINKHDSKFSHLYQISAIWFRITWGIEHFRVNNRSSFWHSHYNFARATTYLYIAGIQVFKILLVILWSYNIYTFSIKLPASQVSKISKLVF